MEGYKMKDMNFIGISDILSVNKSKRRK